MTLPNPLSLTQRSMPDKQMPTGFSLFQRLLLITDGTVTEMLEQYLVEKIKVKKLYEKIEHNRHEVFYRHQGNISGNNLPVMQRKVLLEGQASRNNWVYAESTIVLGHLSEGFRTDLLASHEPIGCLWEKYRLETFKRILDFEQQTAGETLAEYFEIQPQDHVISRTYSVYSGGKLVMIITETFPLCFFRD